MEGFIMRSENKSHKYIIPSLFLTPKSCRWESKMTKAKHAAAQEAQRLWCATLTKLRTRLKDIPQDKDSNEVSVLNIGIFLF